MLNSHTHASKDEGSVNSFAIETEDSLIAVDAQRQTSEARQFIDSLRQTGKPVTALLLTHEHPDHHGGLSAYQAAIEADTQGWMKLSKRILQDDISQPQRADHFVEDGQVLAFGLLKLKVHDLRQGESESMTAFVIVDPGALFCGDLFANQMIPFLFEGRSRLSLQQLTASVAEIPGFLERNAPAVAREIFAEKVP